MTVLMSDFNAKIGADNIGYEETMGTHVLGQMNENKDRFADPCILNQVLIRGNISHKGIHKVTTCRVMENHIDHICISQKLRKSNHNGTCERREVLMSVETTTSWLQK